MVRLLTYLKFHSLHSYHFLYIGDTRFHLYFFSFLFSFLFFYLFFVDTYSHFYFYFLFLLVLFQLFHLLYMHCVFIYRVQNQLMTMATIGELKTHHIANSQKNYFAVVHEFVSFGLSRKTFVFCICGWLHHRNTQPVSVYSKT